MYTKHKSDEYTSYIKVSPDDIQHFGIAGMKWGQRRYQNKDGSYTTAGKERYGIGDSIKKAAESVGKSVSSAANSVSKSVSSAANSATNWVKKTSSNVENYVRGKRVEAIQAKGEKQMEQVRSRRTPTGGLNASDTNGRKVDVRRKAMEWAKTVENNPKAVKQCMDWMFDEMCYDGMRLESLNYLYKSAEQFPENMRWDELRVWLKDHKDDLERAGITGKSYDDLFDAGPDLVADYLEYRIKSQKKTLSPYKEAYDRTEKARRDYRDDEGIIGMMDRWFKLASSTD